MAHDVFISYSTIDKVTADSVCSILEKFGVRCWIAPRDAIPGIRYAGSITESISNCKVLVVIVSSNSNSSKAVINELELAMRHSKIIIPFRIEDIIPSHEMEYYLGSTHWLDALTPPLEKHIEKLKNTITNLLSADHNIVQGHEEVDKSSQREKTMQAKAFEMTWLLVMALQEATRGNVDYTSIERVNKYSNEFDIKLNKPIQEYLANSIKDKGISFNELMKTMGGQMMAVYPKLAPYFQAGFNVLFSASRKDYNGIYASIKDLNIPDEYKMINKDGLGWCNNIHLYFEGMLP